MQWPVKMAVIGAGTGDYGNLAAHLQILDAGSMRSRSSIMNGENVTHNWSMQGTFASCSSMCSQANGLPNSQLLTWSSERICAARFVLHTGIRAGMVRRPAAQSGGSGPPERYWRGADEPAAYRKGDREV